MKTMLYTAKFMWDDNREMSTWMRNIIEPIFFKLRGFAVDALNPHYAEWNEEFGDINAPDDDPLKDYGGTEYCKFIQSKTQAVLDTVNKTHKAKAVRLVAGEYGDIEGLVKIAGRLDRHFVVEFIPVE